MDESFVERNGERGAGRPRSVLAAILATTLPPLAAFAVEVFYWPTVTRWLAFTAAVMISSWVGGLASGIIATILSAALVVWRSIPPERTFGTSDLKYWTSAMLFVAIGIALTVLHDRLRRATKERRIFAALVENSTDFIGIADPSGKPVYLNPAGRRMVGFPANVPVETTQITDYYPPDVRPFASDVIVRGMAEQGQWGGETYFRHWRTEDAIPVSDTHFMIDDPETGQRLGMATITRDISVLRQARDQLESANRQLQQTMRDLEKSQQILQAAFGHSPNVIVVKDLKGRYILSNRLFAQMLEMSLDDVHGKTDHDVLDPAMAKHHGDIDASVLETGESVTIEEAGEMSDGTHSFLATVFALRDDSGTSFGVCWIGTDITEIKRTQQQLQRTAADLKQAQRLGQIGSWCWNAKTGALEWSEELYHIHGWDPSRPPPSYRDELPRLFTRESKAAIDAAVENVLKDGQPFELELEIVLPDGSNRWLAVRGEAVRAGSGEIAGIRGTSQDITKLKQLQRLKDEWMSVIAHDLRQPIGTIAMAAQLLPDLHVGKMGDQEAGIAERIRSAATGLARMVDDLLDMSRLESHRLSVEQKWSDPRQIVHQCVERLAHVTAGRQVTISEGGALSPVYVDPLRFEQILGNLVSNAVKYGEKDAEIRVHMEQREHDVQISVTNQGAGIPPEEVPRIFTRFSRSPTARKSGATGLGLGLYISKGLVEAHGGRMWVESEAGKATTFHFTVPSRGAEKAVA